ncbi:DsbA family oxidoreductase [Fulvivirga ligni]|uniref:DsbA family oxidoreductase n=1 Tax=Fulvivirga ligni TaxID=2904246 RepID=UPI001F190E96|nr:DsbA family oxidoreductase [Fulvivirga ligni]UII24029.1 DsbA family oxidoreductase [Fulvivirga ligni]
MSTSTLDKKVKVEIWSDIMCPFCYIGKRKFEAALAQFEHGDAIEIEWRSYQLDPSIPEDLNFEGNVYQYLADAKGISYDQSSQMHENVVAMAKEVGLDYNFDIAKVANSFKAHRLIQLAKKQGLGDDMEELMFKSYFTEGKNLGETEVLVGLGKEVGLSEEQVLEALNNDEYAYQVKQDIQEGAQLGLRGVPFFVFNRKYGISGAQPVEAFLQTLEKSAGE